MNHQFIYAIAKENILNLINIIGFVYLMVMFVLNKSMKNVF